MNPLWIVNFAKKDAVESFFATYWNAVLQNTKNGTLPQQWFYITDGTSLGSHRSVIDDVARRLTEDTQQDGRLINKYIPSAGSREERLNVVFIGDLTERSTQDHFHTLAAELRAELLGDTPWSSIPTINFYGLLWRPNTVNFAPGVEPDEQAFLNELNTLMGRDVNHMPFLKVFLFESSIKPEEKEDAMNAMAMAALHIALGHASTLTSKFVNTGVAGIFYEKTVQKEKEAYVLSNILIDSFANSRKPEFFDAVAATEYVDAQGGLIASVQAEEIGRLVTENCPLPDAKVYAWDLKNKVSPFSMNLKAVWEQYYCDYIVNFKRNLVNRIKKGTAQFAQDYKDKLFANQHKYVKGKAKELEDQVFNLFSVTTPSKVVGIQQGIEVLNKFHQRIKMAAGDLAAANFQSFRLPNELEKAYEQVKNEHQNPNDTLNVLEGKLKNHPIFILSMLVRSVILGFLVAYFGVFLVEWIAQQQLVALGWFAENPVVTGTLLFAIPVIYAFVRFNEYVVRIRSLKEQYISCMLMKMKLEIEDDIRKCVEKTYHDLDEYCTWLRVNKLEYLQKNLSVIPPSDFSFTESVHFQPMLKCSVSADVAENNRLLIPVVSVQAHENLQELKMTGSFNGADILLNPPSNYVRIQGTDYLLENVEADERLNLKSKLVRELLASRATIYSSVEKNVQFGRKTLPNAKLLLLDISGSMCGNALMELKDAVSRLSADTCIKWIAFNHEVVCTSQDDIDFMTLTASGGTCYIPALQKAGQLIDDCYVDQIILVSDGVPAESLEDILKAAHTLGQPVNVISIGTNGMGVMKELAEKTSGTQIIVEDVSQIGTRLGNDLHVLLSMGDNGTFAFGDLLRKCHIPGCARALYDFVIDRSLCAGYSIISLLVEHGNRDGLKEWGAISEPTCRYSQAGNRQWTESYCKLVTDGREDELQQILCGAIREPAVEPLKDMPDMFALLLRLEPVELKDLQWAGMAETNRHIRQGEALARLGIDKAVNIFGVEFKWKG